MTVPDVASPPLAMNVPVQSEKSAVHDVNVDVIATGRTVAADKEGAEAIVKKAIAQREIAVENSLCRIQCLSLSLMNGFVWRRSRHTLLLVGTGQIISDFG